MSRRHVEVVFPAEFIAQALREVDSTFPLESGGVLMGRWDSPTNVTIEAVIGPGPMAQHQRYCFRPDMSWQHEQIASHYLRTDGAVTYLGDWHSHPHARHGRLSYRDEQALHLIMSTSEAQCPEPLMALLWGAPESWNLAVWQARQGWVPPWRKVRLQLLHCIEVSAPNSP